MGKKKTRNDINVIAIVGIIMIVIIVLFGVVSFRDISDTVENIIEPGSVTSTIYICQDQGSTFRCDNNFDATEDFISTIMCQKSVYDTAEECVETRFRVIEGDCTADEDPFNEVVAVRCVF